MELQAQERRALSRHLKQHLAAHKLSYTAFAQASGINNNTVARLTHPDKFAIVQKGTRKRLERALGLTWKQLLIGEPGEAKANGAHENTEVKVERANGSNGHGAERHPARRMLVIEMAGSRILIPVGAEVSILDETTIRVR